MLPERLTLLRKEKKLTQEELSSKLHIGRSSYAHYEAAERKPGIDALINIADFHSVSLDYLVGRTDIRKPYPKK